MSRWSKDRGSRSISIGTAPAAGQPNENAGAPALANTGAGATTGPGDEFVYVAGEGQAYQRPFNVIWDVRTKGTGSYTSRTVNLEASIDGSNWDIIDQFVGTGGTSRVVANAGGYLMFRGNIPVGTPPVVAAGSPITEVGITL